MCFGKVLYCMYVIFLCSRQNYKWIWMQGTIRSGFRIDNKINKVKQLPNNRCLSDCLLKFYFCSQLLANVHLYFSWVQFILILNNFAQNSAGTFKKMFFLMDSYKIFWNNSNFDWNNTKVRFGMYFIIEIICAWFEDGFWNVFRLS